jgi:hypothetical protein
MVVGREVERAFAEILVTETAGGQSRTLVVRGEPGIGKSWLLAHLAAVAAAGGFRVLAAASGTVDARLHGPPAQARALLCTLAADRPVLLLLDDVHRADRRTVGLVDHLLRYPPEGPVLLVVALRPQEAPPALVRVLHRGELCGGSSSIELGPLSVAESCALLAAVPGAAERARIVAGSGGNPRRLQQQAVGSPHSGRRLG